MVKKTPRSVGRPIRKHSLFLTEEDLKPEKKKKRNIFPIHVDKLIVRYFKKLIKFIVYEAKSQRPFLIEFYRLPSVEWYMANDSGNRFDNIRRTICRLERFMNFPSNEHPFKVRVQMFRSFWSRAFSICVRQFKRDWDMHFGTKERIHFTKMVLCLEIHHFLILWGVTIGFFYIVVGGPNMQQQAMLYNDLEFDPFWEVLWNRYKNRR